MRHDEPKGSSPLEWWGGIECTVNRIGNTFCDQLNRSGHDKRLNDLDQIAALGIRTLRYPVLWERTAPERLDQPDWSWPDERMNHLKSLNIEPIVGLVHHGSGPKYASFTSEKFVSDLPVFARQVAERYPWVKAYTPVNEPLTTARFSGLYGIWYPEGRDSLTFAQILLRECRATIEAMRQIRQVQPEAMLVQTEDLGQTHSVPSLAYQADFENHRRWLTWDLLAGRVIPGHPMWEYLCYVGISERELWQIAEAPCPPDILGVNHYLTSERYLDLKLNKYPETLWGGNGRHAYVDTEAVRAAPKRRVGLAGLLMQACERYNLPIVVTEAHLGCTVDEQLRYLWEVKQLTEQARNQGADVRAVTVWSLLGAYDWDCLLTQQRGSYEAGAFEVSEGTLHRTPLAALVECLARNQPAEELIPAGKGWWHQV